MSIVEEAILSTDLAMYFDKQKKFADYLENGEFDFQDEDKKDCKPPIKRKSQQLQLKAEQLFSVAAAAAVVRYIVQ